MLWELIVSPTPLFTNEINDVNPALAPYVPFPENSPTQIAVSL
jgi:hypothetical protein